MVQCTNFIDMVLLLAYNGQARLTVCFINYSLHGHAVMCKPTAQEPDKGKQFLEQKESITYLAEYIA